MVIYFKSIVATVFIPTIKNFHESNLTEPYKYTYYLKTTLMLRKITYTIQVWDQNWITANRLMLFQDMDFIIDIRHRYHIL